MIITIFTTSTVIAYTWATCDDSDNNLHLPMCLADISRDQDEERNIWILLWARNTAKRTLPSMNKDKDNMFR